eukprot:446826_1
MSVKTLPATNNPLLTTITLHADIKIDFEEDLYYPDLIDAQKIAKEFPDTFKVRTLNDLIENITVNTLVKVCDNVERFWVIVRGFIEDDNHRSIIGEIHNQLVLTKHYNYPDLIAFDYENVYEIGRNRWDDICKFKREKWKLNNCLCTQYQIKSNNMKIGNRQFVDLCLNPQFMLLAEKKLLQHTSDDIFPLNVKIHGKCFLIQSIFVRTLSSKSIMQKESIKLPVNKQKKQLLVNLAFFSVFNFGMSQSGFKLSLFLASFERLSIFHKLTANFINIIALIENVTKIQNVDCCIRDMFYYLTAQFHDPTKTNDNKVWIRLELGALMYFMSYYVSKIFESASISNHARKVQAVFDDNRISDNERNCIINPKLKQWRKNLVETGKIFINETFSQFEESYCGDRTVTSLYIHAKFYEKEKSYQKAKMYYLMATFDVHSFYTRTITLRKCSRICHKHLKEHAIALKLLKYAHQICCIDKNNIITSTFALDTYFQKKQKIKEKLNTMKCTYCNQRNSLQSCSGCMKALYCNRKCQKRDWSTHKTECDGKNGEWHVNYKSLRLLMSHILFNY